MNNSLLGPDPIKTLKDKVFEDYCLLEAKSTDGSITKKEEKKLNRLRHVMVREFGDYLNIYD